MDTHPQNIKYSLKEYKKNNKDDIGLTFDELENFIIHLLNKELF